MDLNLNIKKIGKLKNIFGFYRYLAENYESKNHALLESVGGDSHEMLFSFIGLKPDFMIKVIDDKLEIYDIESETGEKIKEIIDSGGFENKFEYNLPFEDDVPLNMPGIDLLKNVIPISKSAMPELFPRKIFSGGLVGYIGYEAAAPYIGYKPTKIQEDFPDILMGFFTNVLTYSHSTQTLYQVTNSIGNYIPDQIIQYFYDKFKKTEPSNESNKNLISNNNLHDKSIKNKFVSNTTQDEWESMVRKTKEYIFNGDIIQAVISRKMIAESSVTPINVYQTLRILNPSPYMFYLHFDGAHNGDVRIIGSSPEPLITKNQENLETVPIAGTRRRGKNKEDEDRMEFELMHDEKELAEHIMLVDLARNDLARISIPGSIDTYKLIQVKKFPNIMHLISKIRSISYLDPFTVLKSMFPAGTVSGAPKKRAMEIIHELEKEDRGPYAGTVGYISFIGDMDMAISIRTIFNKNTKYIAQAGAGIVADSIPSLEYLETQNKLKGVLNSIPIAEELDNHIK
ncbi:MAG: anthranilate synthase component I family protein [Promethearchaeota archaeon]